MANRPRHAVVVPAVLAGLTGLALLTGCSATNPLTTMNEYSPSDGARTELGDLRLGNLLVVTSGEGEAGVLFGSVTNDGGQDAQVELAVGEGRGTSVDVPSGQTVILGTADGESVDVASVPVAPGALVELSVSSDVAGSTTVRIPVLDGTLPEYEDVLPDQG